MRRPSETVRQRGGANKGAAGKSHQGTGAVVVCLDEPNASLVDVELPEDPAHGIHPEDGSSEPTATTTSLRADDPWLSEYLHDNGYLPGHTPRQHFRNAGADRRTRDRKLTRLAGRYARDLFREHMAHALPEELAEQDF